MNKDKRFACECGKSYKHRQSLFKHRKSCPIILGGFQKRIVESKDNEIKDLRQMVHSLIKSNEELTTEMKTLSNTPKIINQTTNNFNMMNFLNTECKDAMNLTDFLNNIKITFQQLEDTSKYGYLHGIQDTFIKCIKEIEQEKRPIHCTDAKRFSFYLKEDNTWHKELTTDKIDKALDKLVDKQYECLQDWKNNNPDWCDNTHKNNQYIDIMSQITKGHLEDGGKLRRKVHKLLANTCKFTFEPN